MISEKQNFIKQLLVEQTCRWTVKMKLEKSIQNSFVWMIIKSSTHVGYSERGCETQFVYIRMLGFVTLLAAPPA